jgi:hypothetical protein
MRFETVECVELIQDMSQWGTLVEFLVVKGWEFID